MIIIDIKRFREIFNTIFSSYVFSKFLYSGLRAENVGPQFRFWPSQVIPGTKEHLYFLTLVAMSDRRTNSEYLYYCFAKMFSKNPTLFRIGFYPTKKRMVELFRRYQIALPQKEIDMFLERKRHFDEIFSGDPLLIYKDTSTVEELIQKLEHIRKKRDLRMIFPGAKKKIFSLLAMYLSELVKDFNFSDVIPIDTWVMSICSQTGCLKGKGIINFDSLGEIIRPQMLSVFNDFRNYQGAANATWILGRTLCKQCSHMNVSSLCPIFNECKGPSSRMRHPESNKHYGRIQLPPKLIGKGKNIYRLKLLT